jgi:hypothetical protein
VARSDEQVIEGFGEAVNMSREELEDRLQTGEYKEVGQKDGGESEGHESGAGSSNYSTKIIRPHRPHAPRRILRPPPPGPEAQRGERRIPNWRYSVV